MTSAAFGSLRDQVIAHVTPWLESGGYVVDRHDHFDLLISASRRELLLSESDRLVALEGLGEDRTARAASTEILVIDKLLWRELGPEVRARRGIEPELIVRYGDLAPGWSLKSGALYPPGSRASLIEGVTFENGVSMSRSVASADAFIRASFLHPRGSSLFSPADYYTRKVEIDSFRHERDECGGPRKTPTLQLGVDVSGWGRITRCLRCGKYWITFGGPARPLSLREYEESLPWEPPGSFGERP